MGQDDYSEQLQLLQEHMSQISEVISVLEDLSESYQVDGRNAEHIDTLLTEFRGLLASTLRVFASIRDASRSIRSTRVPKSDK